MRMKQSGLKPQLFLLEQHLGGGYNCFRDFAVTEFHAILGPIRQELEQVQTVLAS